ncbi:MAG: 2-oxoglutarate dehydrogenase E1 component [Gammaproteobacteria bacterium]|uniref:2-oxoglutarate dehydrogenase E1 component n=1 Tax=Hydrogenophaga sp. TaxID=1904254 RepID=UPI000CAA67BD|nr:2-oxoglutarate dehydrogenase E1 component [Hydrogenophaga sp.]MBU4180556.1 2-oxoglutarate dehydrogenase E1 component [Gammaproteobacteria bacterium]PKO75151.1 MAG: 2-oxoglutarate dehydrogenase E1 component [Betaproteobacteria bacterium HGW-Betaproteobacteria-15]MBU4279511.1 2-oxoglutarate dehydrogenase E1 component [Gammaproteobacteria bacterium]MBU4325831.1 2-oxoglutarate dehydrogenase E1 component [Gammaproteobacteria bacterium]MCG2653962.1 2-oxoglutarate dehydrogenase E1 component [Hydro
MSNSPSNGGNVYVAYQNNSYLFGGNAPYVEEMYEKYLENPGSVPDNWRGYFDALQHVPAGDGSDARDVPHQPVINAFAERAKQGGTKVVVAAGADSDLGRKRVAVQQLIAAYRNVGSRWADLDPLKRTERDNIPELDPAFYGFSDADFETVFNTSNTFFGKEVMSLRDLLNALRETYCASVGAEYMYISDQTQKRWWQEKLEAIRSKPAFNAEKKKAILDRLTAAEGLERFLHTKYVGQKRFSLEGGESFIAAMDEVIQQAGAQGVQEIVIGMAHRGRLNVLVNILGKMPKDLFAEFDHTAPEDLPAGDVKYHQGFSSDVTTPGGPVHLSLAFNPSHLEIVNPVVEGSVRARMDRRGDPLGKQVLPVLVHGDAAFAGQGVNQETLALAATRGYTTGGTVHLIINNQIGFTTSDPRDLRSTLYCTDIVKGVEAPVLHVNGDDPEAVVLATQLALEYRMTFRKDVVLDIICFRKLGHNEQDTPSLTQPLMYKKISAHPGTRKLYADKLAAQGLGETLGDDMAKAYRAALDAGRHTVDPVLTNFKSKYAVDWSPFLGKKWTDAGDTAIPMAEWKRLAGRLTTIPESVSPHQLVKKVYADRAAMGRGDIPVDWGMGEHMAFASLVASGFPVRLSGEDCGRGTFTHRHAVIHDQNREKWDTGTYTPLQNVADNQAPFVVIDSILSEEAVLGFEYGYASNDPNTLVIWEAQFGDFANGAQVVIDQFIASGEVKWGRVNGITLMLPHGYEGQGPEHSSARLERFMQLAADTNMQIVQPTTASQIFHILRRQVIRNLRKPLVIFTPKSLLRNKDATSPLSEFTKGSFQTVIPESNPDVVKNADKVKRLICCSGKVYYDLVKKREERGDDDVAILRVEQLYPFPHKVFGAEIKKYPNATDIVWCQDEPQNQGAWFFVQHYIHENMLDGQKLGYAGRAASASPAVGYAHLHQEQQKTLIEAAFGKLKGFILTK